MTEFCLKVSTFGTKLKANPKRFYSTVRLVSENTVLLDRFFSERNLKAELFSVIVIL